MDEPTTSNNPFSAEDSSDVPRVAQGHPVIAWLVICGLTVIISTRLLKQQRPADQASKGSPRVLEALEVKYLVGVSFLPGQTGKTIFEKADRLRTGPVSKRLRFAVLAGELVGSEQAVRELVDLHDLVEEKKVLKASGKDLEVLRALRRLYTDYATGGTTVTDAQRELIEQQLGWVGKLALLPEGTAQTAQREALLQDARFVSFVVVGLAMVVVALVVGGLAAICVIAVLVYNGRLRPTIQSRDPPGAIYAETFAIWFVVFFLGNLLGRWLGVPRSIALAFSGGVALLSLSALAWPVLRGISWKQVRKDVGLCWGDRPAFDVFWGPLCYLTAIPLLGLGVLLMFLLLAIQSHLHGPGGASPQPTHPVVHILAEPSVWICIQVFVLAAVIAPIVEEIVFRGVLYRHLREGTAHLGMWASIGLGTLINSFIFAVIHPQGWLAVPVLMALAAAFTFARELRGSVVPCILAHGIHNGIITTVMISLL